MATDKNGRKLEVGDVAWIEGTIEEVAYDDRHVLMSVRAMNSSEPFLLLFTIGSVTARVPPPDEFQPAPKKLPDYDPALPGDGPAGIDTDWQSS